MCVCWMGGVRCQILQIHQTLILSLLDVKEKLCVLQLHYLTAHLASTAVMNSSTAVENIYLLVIVTLISVLQNGEIQPNLLIYCKMDQI